MQDTPLNPQTSDSPYTTNFNYQSNNIQHATRSQRLSSTKNPEGSKCFLLVIPGESLTHITTYIDDPSSLFALSRVSRRLRDHVADDNTWYRVFAFRFLGIGPESEPKEETRLLLRRTESTWKKEFIQRFNVIRRWEKSRSSTLRYQPHYWTISGMHLLENISLMTSNLQYGIVTRSFPLTGMYNILMLGDDPYHALGKILKGHLDASGTTDGLGIGNPNEEFSPNVTCIGLSSCGGTGRVIWGFRNGEIAMTSAARVMDSSRPPARFTRCQVDDGHIGDVRCVSFTGREDGLIVSGCSHGQVKLWDAKRMRCLWTGFGKKEGAMLPDPCVKAEYCVRAKALVASLQGGDIMLWWGFQLQDDGIGGQLAIVGIVHALRITHPAQSTIVDGKPVGSLFVDCESSPSKVKILVHRPDEQYFLRLVVDLPSGYVTTTRFCDGPIGALTSVRPCFVAHHRGSAMTSAAITPVNTSTGSLPLNHAADLIVSRETSYVLAGDTLGRVCVWDWDADGVVAKHDPLILDRVETQVNASRRWEAHDDGAVCVIETNSVVIITGSVRGTLKVWDSLTLAPLRSFASPATKPSLTGQWDPVGQIAIRGDLLVASVGSRILVWQAGAVVTDKKGKTKYASKPKVRGAGNTLSKWQQQIELNRDILESKRLLDDERAHAQRVYGRARAQLSTLDQLGLSETEAVEYVMMLSREDEEGKRASMSGSGSPPTHPTTPELDAMLHSNDTDGIFTLDDDSAGPRSSTPAPVSPILRPSPTSSHHPDHTHFYARSLSSSSNSEEDLSSDFVHSEAEFNGNPRLSSAVEYNSSVSPMLMAASPSLETSRATATTGSSFDDLEAFPAISSSSGMPIRSVSGSSLQLSGSWSKGSPSSPSLLASGQGDSVTSSSTSSSPLVGTWSSVLGQFVAQRRNGRSRAEVEDEELRYVLQLSLAEARSRGEE